MTGIPLVAIVIRATITLGCIWATTKAWPIDTSPATLGSYIDKGGIGSVPASIKTEVAKRLAVGVVIGSAIGSLL